MTLLALAAAAGLIAAQSVGKIDPCGKIYPGGRRTDPAIFARRTEGRERESIAAAFQIRSSHDTPARR